MSELKLRSEQASDRAAIYALHRASFPSEAEAKLVDQLRKHGDAVISLVADDKGAVLGHVMFSRMTAPLRALGLGPVAVHAERRRQGIAAGLIEQGLRQAKDAGWDGVFVLGDPRYYRRFGFKPAPPGFLSPYAGPNFMVLSLNGELPVREGPVDYAPPFSELG